MKSPSHPGELISKMNSRMNKLAKVESKEHGMKFAHKAHKKHHASAVVEHHVDKMAAHHAHKHAHHALKAAHHAEKAAHHAAEMAKCAQKAHHAGKKHAKKLPHLKPKGKRGKAQVGRLNRTFKTGGFSKIASKAGKSYGSKEAGKRVAGAIFNKMAKARGNA
jgi:hypothetical protein